MSAIKPFGGVFSANVDAASSVSKLFAAPAPGPSKRRLAADAKRAAAAAAPKAAPPPPSEAEVKKQEIAAAEAATTPEDAAAKLARTVFVGNVPTDASHKKLKRHFEKYGKLDSVRVRSAAAANLKMPQKAAVITRELDTAVRDSVNVYVVFKSAAGAAAAVAANGALALGRHLRIDAATAPGEGSAASERHDTKRSVFLGNLAHDLQEETLWKLFGACGAIEYVRLIREQRTQQGKGFGYVGFVEAGSVERALALHDSKIGEVAASEDEKGKAGRPVRVFRCSAAKSHRREVEAGKAATKGAKKPKVAAAVAAAAEEEGDGEEGHEASVGWQARERRRLLKKKMKVQERNAASSKGGKAKVGGEEMMRRPRGGKNRGGMHKYGEKPAPAISKKTPHYAGLGQPNGAAKGAKPPAAGGGQPQRKANQAATKEKRNLKREASKARKADRAK